MKKRDYYICADAGTSSLKAGVLYSDGTLVSQVRVPFQGDLSAQGDRMDPNHWYTAFYRAVSQLVKEQEGRCRGISVSGHGPTLAFLGPDAEPVCPSILWFSDKARPDKKTVSFFLPRVLWLKESDESLFNKTKAVLGCPEYIMFRLTGESCAVSPSQEFDRFIWVSDEIENTGLSPDLFPPLVRVGAPVGKVSAHSGLKKLEGTPVYAGGSDFLMSLLGTGTVKEGRTCDRAGSSEGINHCTGRHVSSPWIRSLPHVISGLYNAAGILSSSGRVFEWYRSLTGREHMSYLELMKRITESSKNEKGPRFFPSFHRGESWEFHSGVFTGLHPDHGPDELGQSIVESIGFGIRQVLDVLREEGCSVNELRASGGQAKNPVWNQLKADLTGVPVAVPAVCDAELTGNLCAIACGENRFGNLQDASEQLVTFARTYEPEKEFTGMYRDRFEQYRRQREGIIEIVDRFPGLGI